MSQMVLTERREVTRVARAERGTAIVEDGIRRGFNFVDVSAKGAQLQLGSATALPLRFEMLLPNGRRAHALLIWQRGSLAGVQFELHPTLVERLLPRSWLRRG